MFIRGPIKRVSLLFSLFFIITFVAYFYLIHKNIDVNGFEGKSRTFKNAFRGKLQAERPMEEFQLENVKENSRRKEKAVGCMDQLSLQKADIEIGSLYASIPFENKNGGVWKQGFEISYDPSEWGNQKLEVIILPHSHHDSGWISTINEYFQSSTRRGLDATVDFLGKNPSSRFIYAEVVFLDMWWQTLSPSVRTLFIKLVREGQWEIGTGGWVMNDEALTHYGATVSQLIEGQHWLLDNLGVLPNVSWVIDAFGYSTTEAYILAKAGIKNILIHRVHYEVKKALAEKRHLEFIWRQPWDSAGDSSVFTHMMPFYSYDIPHTCGPDPSICCQFDFMRFKLGCPWGILPVRITPENVAERARILADQYRKNSKLYNNSGVLLVILGDDFRFLTADEWNLQVSNYDKLMNYINNEKSFNMNVRFGTLSEYFQLVNSRKPTKDFPTFQGDFFTYADVGDDFWNGYYTSRPSHKAMSRFVEAEVRNADILFSFARHWAPASASVTSNSLFTALYDKLRIARRNLALFQHHDAITGTAKSAVMKDFRQRLAVALSHAQNISAISAGFLLGYEFPEVYPALEAQADGSSAVLVPANPSWKAAASMPELYTVTLSSLEDTKTVYIYNSLPHARDHVLRLQVNMSNLVKILKKQVKNPQTVSLNIQFEEDKTSVPVQLEPWSDFNAPEHLAPLFRFSAGPIHLAPMELVRLKLKPAIEASGSPAVLVTKPTLYRFSNITREMIMFYMKGEERSLLSQLISNLLEVKFDKDTGLAQTILNKRTGDTHRMEIGFEYMNPSPNPGSAGAYIGASFVSKEPLSTGPVKLEVIRGPLTEEVTSYYPRVKHTLRINKLDTPARLALEVENVVNLTGAANSIELVMTIKTNINNQNGVFFTDSNCFQMVKRKYYTKIRQWGNVYPMSCAAFIEDGSHRLTLLSGQPLGVMAGEHPGEVKVWLDRRTFMDDKRGMAESMVDNQPSRSIFRILLERISRPNGEDTFVPSLTTEAHYVLNDLIFPSAQFFTNFDSTKLVSSRMLMVKEGFPFDYELVTMKTFFSKSERFSGLDSVEGGQLGMIVRRTVHACGSTQLCDDFCISQHTNQAAIRVREVFPDIVTKKVVKTPVTLIPDKSVSKSTELDVTVGAMEMEGYLLVPESAEIKLK